MTMRRSSVEIEELAKVFHSEQTPSWNITVGPNNIVLKHVIRKMTVNLNRLLLHKSNQTTYADDVNVRIRTKNKQG